MRYSTLGGGKRLRGIVAMEGARLGPDSPSPGASPVGEGLASAVAEVGAAATLASALEMIHAYSLVHDDLPCMDDDDFRRGRPSNHRVFGEGMAVLTGDALLTRAFELLLALPWAGVPAERAVRIAAEVARAGGRRVSSEVRSPTSRRRAGDRSGEADGPGPMRKRRSLSSTCKTGALFKASLCSGAILGGVSDEGLVQISEYADGIGIAFQIVDDVLDVVGEAESLGKATGSDHKKGKLTFVTLYGVERAMELAEAEARRAKEALRSFGEKAHFLQALADYILTRDR